MQRFNQAIKLFIRAQKARLSLWVFNYLWRDPMSGMRESIEASINQRTAMGIMNWLDAQRILHCAFCPETHELRNQGGGKLCARHLGMVETNGKIPA